MSTTIDERVVEMKFDNSSFETDVQTTMGTLEKLKSALKLDGASRGLESIGTAASNMDLSGVQEGVSGLARGFNALEVAGITAVANITNDITNKLKRAINEVTLAPIKAGFDEYNTQMNAVQTILANTQSKGEDINSVNAALDELNRYADKTIYNFTEMTNNIGRFTAAGVDLSVATDSIQGISNLAAVSGSTAQQASTAMYQLSQAISSGTLKLQDWNSVVNAGMGGETFQNALKQTAKATLNLQSKILSLSEAGKTNEQIASDLGITLEKVQKLSKDGEGYLDPDANIDFLIEKAGSFRESLKDGWITADVLTETLGNLTIEYGEVGDAQYEAAKKNLIANGYMEDEVDAILQLSKTAVDAATKVKTIPQLWDTLKESVQSGWTQSWEYIVGDFEEARTMLTSVSNTLGDIVGRSADARNEILKQWHDDGGRASLIEAISNAFKALMNVITPVSKAFKDIFPSVTADQLVAFSAALAVLTERLKNLTADAMPTLTSATKSVLKPIAAILSIFTRLGGILANAVSKILQPLSKAIVGLGSMASSLFATMSRGFTTTLRKGDAFGKLADAGVRINAVFTALTRVVERLFQSVKGSKEFQSLSKILHAVALELGKLLGTAVLDTLDWLTNLIIHFGANLVLFTANFKKFWSDVIDKLRNSDVIKSIFGELKPAGETARDFAKSMDTTYESLKAFASSTIGKVYEAIKKILDVIIPHPSAEQVAGIIEGIAGAIKFLADIATSAVTGVKNFFGSLASSVTDSASNGLLGSVKNLFGSIGTMISDFFASSHGGDGEGKSLLQILGERFSVKEVSTGLADILGALTSSIATILGTALGGLAGLISSVIGQFGDTVAKILEGKSITQILSWLRSGAITYLIGAVGSVFASIGSVGRQAAGIMKSVRGVVNGVVDIEKSISKTIKAYGSVLKAEAKEKRAEAFLKIAEAIGILAASMFVLGNMDINAILQGAVVIGAMMFLLNKLVDTAGDSKVSIAAKGLDKLKGAVSGFFGDIKDSLTQAVKLVGMSAVAIGVGVTVGLLSIAILKLAELNRNGGLKDAWNAVGMITALLAIVTTALIAISRFSGDKGGLAATATVIGMAVAINILSKSMDTFSKMKPEQFLQGLGGVVAIILAMTALTAASSGSKLLGVGVGILLVAAALNMLMGPLQTIASMDDNALKTGLVSLGLIVGFLTLIGVLASSSLAGAASILIISAALVILTPALLALGAAAPVALAGMLSVAAGLAAVALAGLLLAPASAFILQAAGAFVVMAGAMLMASVAFSLIVLSLTAFAGAVTMLSTALPLFAKGLMAACTAVAQSGPALVNAIFAIISSISTAIATGAPMLAMAIGTAIISIVANGCRVISSCVGPIVETILTVIQAILEGIANHAQQIVEALLNIVGAIFLALYNSLGKAFEWLQTNVLGNVQRMFLTLKLTVANAIKGLFDSISEMGIPVISNLAGNFSEGIDGFISDIEGKINEIDLKDAVTGKLTETADSVAEGASSVETATSGVGESITSALSGLFSKEDGEAKGGDLMSGLASGISNGLPDLKGAIGGIFGGGESAEGGLSGMLGDLNVQGSEAGTDLTSGLATSITDGTPDVQNALGGIFGGGEDDASGGGSLFGDMSLKGSTAGTDLLNSLGTSIDEGAPSLKEKISGLLQFDAEDTAAKTAEQGKNIDEGLAQGVNDNAAVTTDAATAMATATADASAAELGIQSPSTKFAEQGKYIDEGLANGIKDNQNKVTTAITTMLSMVQRTVTSQTTKFKTEGGKIPTNFASGISGGIEKVKTAATKMATTASTAAGSKETAFKTAGTNSASKFADGLASKNEDIQNKGVSAADSFITGVNSKAGSASSAGSSLASNAVSGAASRNAHNRDTTTFYSVGQDAADGFTIGINSKAKAAADAAAKMAADALTAAQTTIKSSSPSKKFMELGEYSSEGFAIGMTNLTGMVAESSRSVAQSAIDSVTGAVKRFNTLSSDDASLKPVISPVIDTSSAISNIRGLNRAVSLAEGMATTAKISENVEASYTVNNDQAEMQAMMKGMYAYMTEYFPQFASNKYAVLPESTVSGLTRTINRRLGAQLL